MDLGPGRHLPRDTQQVQMPYLLLPGPMWCGHIYIRATFSSGAIQGHPIASRNCRVSDSLVYSDLLYSPRLQIAGQYVLK